MVFGLSLPNPHEYSPGMQEHAGGFRLGRKIISNDGSWCRGMGEVRPQDLGVAAAIEPDQITRQLHFC